MPKEDVSPVAQQRVWEEHLNKEARQQSKFREASEAAPFSLNPQSLKAKTLPKVKINEREARFLDRERAALATIQKQLASRAAAASAPATVHPNNAATVLPAIASPSQTRQNAGASQTYESLPTLSTKKQHEQSLDELMARVHQGPKAKYAFPQTEAQELGWMTRPLVKPDRQFQHGLKSCDVTAFAHFAVSRKN